MDVPVKFGDSSSNGSRDASDAAFLTVFFLNFDNCQPEVVSDVISRMVNQESVWR